MTNLEAADELERVANICTSTALSIAAMMGANLLRAQQDTTDAVVKHDCPTCKHRDRMPGMYPCDGCSSEHDKWEPKEVDNEQGKES